MSTKKVVVIEGEDAAPEAVRPSLELVQSFGLDIEWIHPAVGEVGKKASGSPFPAEAKDAIDNSDATLFGATNGKSIAALFYLRWGKETYANVRPARWMPGYCSPLAHPQDLDLIILRENLEDLYLGIEGDLTDLAPAQLKSPMYGKAVEDLAPGKYAIKAITEAGSERIVRFAFKLANERKAAGGRGKVTCACKYNMLPRSDGLFRQKAQAVSKEFPDIDFDDFIIDDFACRLVAAPGQFDVVVMPNLYGDIMSDAAAGLIGGLGLAPSGCYGRDYAYFESAHGSAPDIAGQNIINPTATLLSAAMMLEYLGFADEGTALRNAIEAVYAEGKALTPDQGGMASTTDFCKAVEVRLSS